MNNLDLIIIFIIIIIIYFPLVLVIKTYNNITLKWRRITKTEAILAKKKEKIMKDKEKDDSCKNFLKKNLDIDSNVYSISQKLFKEKIRPKIKI